MDTGLKLFLGGAVVGVLLFIKTLYQMCSAMFNPPPGSGYGPEEPPAEKKPALPKPGSPAAVLGAAKEAKTPKAQGEGMAFGGGKGRGGASRGRGLPTQKPLTTHQDEDTATLLEGDSEDEEPAEKPRRGAANGGKSSRRDGGSRGGSGRSRQPEGSESSDPDEDRPDRPLKRCGDSSVVSSRASHLSDKVGASCASSTSRSSKATQESFLNEISESRPRKGEYKSPPHNSPAKRVARLPAHLTCD